MVGNRAPGTGRGVGKACRAQEARHVGCSTGPNHGDRDARQRSRHAIRCENHAWDGETRGKDRRDDHRSRAPCPQVEVDGDRGTLVRWEVQEQGIRGVGTVRDGGRAIQDAVRQVHGAENHQREVWHRFPVAAHVQGRLNRAVTTEHDRVSVIQQQAEREAAGRRARGRRPKATLTEQQAVLARMSAVAESVGSFCQELHTVLEVVVPCSAGVLRSRHRQGDIKALLDLLDERVPVVLPALQKYIQMLSTHFASDAGVCSAA